MEQNEINVEEIMREIREEIRKKGYAKGLIPFEDIPIRGTTHYQAGQGSLEESVSLLQMRNQIAWARPLPNGIKGLIMRVIRKTIRFFIIPIVTEQNEYNWRVAQTMEQLYKRIKEQNEEIMALRQQVIREKS